MSRFKNDGGGVLRVNDLGREVGPYEEFDWPDHDPEIHGLPTGCTWLDAPKAKQKAGAKADDPPDGAADSPDDAKAPAKRGKAADKEPGE